MGSAPTFPLPTSTDAEVTSRWMILRRRSPEIVCVADLLDDVVDGAHRPELALAG